MNNELVSVIIPCHNNASTILRAIDSVLKQTYQNIEIIVIDDVSTDNSTNIVKSINDPKVTLLVNKTNLKAGITRNVGLDKARGQYIAFLDADDAYREDKIELDIAFLDAHPEYDFVCNEIVSMGLLGTRVVDTNLVVKEVDLRSMLTKASIFTSTVTMKNAVKERFPENFYVSEDLYYWCKILLAKHRIARTNRKTTFYNNELTNRLSLNYKKQYINEKKVVDYVFENKAINKGEKAKFKCLYFLKFLRRPLKFKWLAMKEKRNIKKAGK